MNATPNISDARRVMPWDNYVETVKKNNDFTTNDIISLIGRSDTNAGWYVRDFAPELQGRNTRQTCSNIWNFLKENIDYIEDGDKNHPNEYFQKNQVIQAPSQLIHLGFGDCKSFSIFTAACLQELRIPYEYDFVAYPCETCGGTNRHSHYIDGENRLYDPSLPTHVYVEAKDEKGRNVIIDAVWDAFDSERPDYIHPKKKSRWH